MCALYGFINYGKILSQKELKKLVRRLSVASECRGRDASGVAYVRNRKVIIYKKPQPSCEVNFYFPSDITILTGHTRMATQGNGAIMVCCSITIMSEISNICRTPR